MSHESDERELLRRRRREAAKDAEYTVGYAKPDPAHQFKPGNKTGARTKKSVVNMSFEEIIARLGEEMIIVTVGGKRKRVSKNELLATSMLNDALRGDARSRKMYIDALKGVSRGVVRAAKDYPDNTSYAEEVRQKIEQMARRLRETPAEYGGMAEESDAGVLERSHPANATAKPRGGQ